MTSVAVLNEKLLPLDTVDLSNNFDTNYKVLRKEDESLNCMKFTLINSQDICF
jgi:hypothetical protein